MDASFNVQNRGGRYDEKERERKEEGDRAIFCPFLAVFSSLRGPFGGRRGYGIADA
jgi:hypothetical protein